MFSGSSLLWQAIRGDDITVKSYKVESRITSRFAHTTVRSSVVNSGSKAQSIGFNVQIPKQAFITNFTMWVSQLGVFSQARRRTDRRKSNRKRTRTRKRRVETGRRMKRKRWMIKRTTRRMKGRKTRKRWGKRMMMREDEGRGWRMMTRRRHRRSRRRRKRRMIKKIRKKNEGR